MSRIRGTRLTLLMAVTMMMWADTAPAADAVVTPSAVGAGSLLQFGLGLAIVLGLILGAGWFMKRFSFGPTGAGLIKVIAGAPVGQRERVVVVEIGDTWMVLGVAPGRVNTLHTLPRGDHNASHTLAAGAPPNFATWLKHTMDKRRGA